MLEVSVLSLSRLYFYSEYELALELEKGGGADAKKTNLKLIRI